MTNICQETFERFEGEERQRQVFELHDGFGCEDHSCSAHSPAPVSDEEELVFLLINPTHFDSETGVLNPIAFQEVHKRDLSLFRVALATKEEISETVEVLIARGMKNVPPKIRKIDNYCGASCGEVRSISDDAGRTLAVYDTALEEKPSHASVFTRPDVLDSKLKKAKARKELHSLFSQKICGISEIIE